MRYHVVALVAAAAAVSAETIKITAMGDLTFEPDMVQAKEGDVLEFHFEPKNHSVAMGEFDSINGPCVPPNSGGFFSGYMPVSEGESDKVFRVTVNSTEPMVYYCTTTNHCPQGMIGAVNAPQDKLDEYKSKAVSLASSVDPKSVGGGEITTADDSSDNKDDTSDGGSGGDGNDNGANVAKATFGSSIVALVIALMMI